MGTITILRPSATSSATGWTPSAGTLHGATSDDNDATYALWSGSGSEMILATPVDSPPAGERRHQVRLRARGEDGSAWWSVRLSSGVLVAGASAQFSSSPSTVTGSWGFGAPADGSTVLYAYVDGQSTGVKINELYLDMDSREAPTLTPQILDGSGSSTVLVADTAQPIVRADSVDLDDLDPRQYRYWVTLNGAIVWDTGIVSGPAVDRQTTALDNGDYVAHLMVWSTLGQNTEYASDEETLAFTVQVGQIAVPVNPTVTPQPDSPFYLVEACAPYVDSLDGEVGYLEIQRVDCPVGGYLRMATVEGSHASTPEPGAVIGTELEIIVKAGRSDDWRPDTDQVLISQYNSTGNQRSWQLYIDADGDGDPALMGRPVMGWSVDGVAHSHLSATERAPVDPYGVVRLKVSWLLDDGLGGQTLTFWTRETDEDEWTVLGDVLTDVSTTVFDSTADYAVGAILAGSSSINQFDGWIYSAEVRHAIDGPAYASPDFTGHMDGTREITDGQGNIWTVYGSSSIYSPTSTTSIAMLGPLVTDECAEWLDYTLPRSGVGATCDHAPVSCCSYYRARTVGRVDGDLRVSNWSDVFDPAVPLGVIVMWPDTNASIPSGWSRVTELDDKYAKGVATTSTDPGTTGGSASHSHTSPGHTHDTSHVHTVTGATSASTTTVNSTPNSAGSTAALSSHTHTRSSVNSATIVSDTSVPSTGTSNNDPASLRVIYIKSHGSALGVPDGALGLTPDISLSGWTDYANGANRFFKGAAAAGNGGATAATTLDSHTHTINSHVHFETDHTHTSPNTGTFTSTQTLTAGATPVLWQASHSHPVTVASTLTATLTSASGGSSGGAAADLRPPFRNVRVQENTSGDVSLPVGLICAWRGPLGLIPNFWQLCDGTSGTMDLIGRYPQGATSSIGSAGGSSTAHNHTGGSHTHATSGHSHTMTIGSAAAATSNVSTTATVTTVSGTHIHTGSSTNSTTPTVGNSSVGTLSDSSGEPVHEEVAFIQLMEEPTPGPDPDTFCLTWSDDEHLIRTTGPDGPMWAAILGKFEWSVDRPFTVSTGVNGTRFVTSAEPGGRDLTMVCAVESEQAWAELHEILARPLVLISPSDADEVWAAPIAESVRVVKVGRIRQVTASFTGTGPQPAPQLADVGA